MQRNELSNGLPWGAFRRRSSAAFASRRNSLISISLFDIPLYPSRRGSLVGGPEVDPYAPLAINEGISLSKNSSHGQSHSFPLMDRNHHDAPLMDRSENSVPSLSNSSYSSYGSSQQQMQQQANHARGYHMYQNISMNLNQNQSQPIMNQPIMNQPSSFPQLPIPKTVNSSVPVRTQQVSSPTCDDEEDDDDLNQHRFKPFHEEKWSLRYKELLEFHKSHGHAAVPHTYPPNPQLARWVKRQRRQYKLRKDGRPSTMTAERLELLSSVGFIWDSHDVNWREKLLALEQFKRENSHCNVPSNYRDKKLATWVKCQRRQYKLYWDSKPSAMSPERILELEKIGFEWEIRSTVPRNTAPQQPQQPVDEFSLLYQTIADM